MGSPYSTSARVTNEVSAEHQSAPMPMRALRSPSSRWKRAMKSVPKRGAKIVMRGNRPSMFQKSPSHAGVARGHQQEQGLTRIRKRNRVKCEKYGDRAGFTPQRVNLPGHLRRASMHSRAYAHEHPTKIKERAEHGTEPRSQPSLCALGSATVLKIKRADLRSPATGFHVSTSH